MAIRTDPDLVRGVIETDPAISLAPFIDTANSLTNHVSDQDDDSLLDDPTLELIERYLAAHFYEANRDRKYAQKTTGRASAQFQGKTAMVLMSTDPGQTACLLDVTGRLAELSKQAEKGGKPKVGLAWLGTQPDAIPNRR